MPIATAPAGEVHAPTSAWLVVHARVTDRRAITADLAVALPDGAGDGAVPVLAVLALHLAELRRTGTDPDAGALRGALTRAFPQLRGYPYQAVHDPRVSVLVDIALHPAADGGWAGVQLAVTEQGVEAGQHPWSRIIRRHGIRAVLRHTEAELGAAEQHQHTLARTDRSAERRAERVAQLRGAVLAALHQAEQDVPPGTPPPPALGTGARLATRTEARPQVLTGAVTRPVMLREGDDGPVARLLLAPDTPPVIGEVTASVLVCTLRGDAARQAAASLTPGSHVLVVGAIAHRSYTGEDRIPRVALTLDVQHIGQALT
ncbi:single-stranded DNA-binding protein [Streptacidiphilus anmyonensis]|uniref:single-stranded DNA-binding protein n=1 Tax=Streptacidiphilus anmyonensis TaxID=405782 RepID=UPI0005A9FFEA|nr:single-stranded DNA-binding protein [Streptacidiphilus anmyonensis]